MFIFTRTSVSPAAIAWAMLSFTLSPGYCDESPGANGKSREYWVDASVISIDPGGGLESVRSHGAGGLGPTGTVILNVLDGDRNFHVTIKCSSQQGRFLASLTVKPRELDDRTTAMERVFDLSELKPEVLELARDNDGRVYRLSLVPRVMERPLPRIFRAADLALEQWHFQDSPVILNDQDYLGKLTMGSAPIAWVDIPGMAKVEFSLLPLKEAKLEGILKNGTVTITHSNVTRLQITNIRNGVNPHLLAGGPYRVWVRWKEPSRTVEQYRRAVQTQLATIKKQVETGEVDLPRGTIDRLERTLQTDRILQLFGGIRSVQPGELDLQKQ